MIDSFFIHFAREPSIKKWEKKRGKKRTYLWIDQEVVVSIVNGHGECGLAQVILRRFVFSIQRHVPDQTKVETSKIVICRKFSPLINQSFKNRNEFLRCRALSYRAPRG